MNQILTPLIVAVALGGGTVGAVLTYIREVRKNRGDYTVASLETLAKRNDRLEATVEELNRRLDAERQMRRDLEDRMAILEREKREGTRPS